MNINNELRKLVVSGVSMDDAEILVARKLREQNYRVAEGREALRSIKSSASGIAGAVGEGFDILVGWALWAFGLAVGATILLALLDGLTR